MPKYIEREALIENLNRFAPEHYNALVNQLITKQPAADVVEVRRGEWIKHPLADGVVYCSQCGNWRDSRSGAYCSWCGADMRGKKDETQTS